jgi:putative ABC transport system permease protein
MALGAGDAGMFQGQHPTVMPDRLRFALMVAFAILALLLSSVGIFGVVAYSLAQRTREHSIRLALGARPSQLINAILSRTAVLSAGGIVLGLGATGGVVRFIRGPLFGVTPFDLTTLVAVSALFMSIAMLAAFLPAWHVTNLDPSIVLRTD